MIPFTTITARACPLPFESIDTDQLIPARFMKRTRAEGYGDALLHDRRFGADGVPVADFPLNDPRFAGAAILVARRNFGGGSSREAAVYGLADAGFRCVLAPSFGDIFAANAVNNGLLPARLAEDDAEALLALVAAGPDGVTVDLETCTVSAGAARFPFTVDPVPRTKLLNGWDDLDLTASYAAARDAFMAEDARQRPWVRPRQAPDPGAEAAAFAPFEALAARLLPTLPGTTDGSHDRGHLLRVWSNLRAIQAAEGGDGEILAAACLLHDGVAVEKGSPLRAQASRLAADRATTVLTELGWAPERVAAAAHAIEAHSFSAGIEPASLEARILQDADRLDAIGALGIARCFYTAGRLGSALYEPSDPHAGHRALDDRRYALDHFHAKLLHLASGFRTETGRTMAAARHRRMERFVADLSEEIGAPAGAARGGTL